MELNSPALPLLMFLVLLGFVHRVPGGLQQEKGQQRVKPFLAVNINTAFYHRLNCKVKVTLLLPDSFSSCL